MEFFSQFGLYTKLKYIFKRLSYLTKIFSHVTSQSVNFPSSRHFGNSHFAQKETFHTLYHNIYISSMLCFVIFYIFPQKKSIKFVSIWSFIVWRPSSNDGKLAERHIHVRYLLTPSRRITSIKVECVNRLCGTSRGVPGDNLRHQTNHAIGIENCFSFLPSASLALWVPFFGGNENSSLFSVTINQAARLHCIKIFQINMNFPRYEASSANRTRMCSEW